MAFKAKVDRDAKLADTFSVESWANGLDLASIATNLERSSSNGTLAHLEIAGENFASAVAKKSGISQVTIENVVRNVDRMMIDEGYFDSQAAGISTESLGSSKNLHIPAIYMKRKELKDVSKDSILELAAECLRGFPLDTIKSTCAEIASVLSANDPIGAATESVREPGINGLSLYDACGARAYSHYANTEIATEAFGATINQLNINTRLAVAVSILRNFNSTIDKLFLRVTDETNTVVMTIPSPVVFSLELMNNHKSSVRNNPETEVPLVNIHAEPGIVNTAPQEVMPNINPVNDTTPKSLDMDSTPGQIALRANGVQANLFDLTLNENRYGYESVNHTDSIAEGGTLSYIIIEASKTTVDASGNSSSVVEYFTLPTAGLPSARYITTANNIDSGDTIVTIQDFPFTITGNSVTNQGAKTTLFASLGKANVSLRVNFVSNLRLKYGDINGAGGVSSTIVPAAGVSDDAAATDIAAAAKALDGVSFTTYSYIPKLFFNEENLRKTTVATRVHWMQRSFQIPQGKMFTTDTALDQEKETASIETIQTAMSIGNSDRGMSVAESRLEEIADIIETGNTNPEIFRRNRIQNLSYAATLCRPYVLRATADYTKLTVSVMRESERLTDKHAKMVQILLNALSNVTTRSLYNTSINPGERIVFKALMHQVPADLLFNIPSYHPTLEDKTATANQADYSFLLPNGYRIDVVKTNFHNWQKKIIIVPVKEDDPASILSFATIRDRGVFAGTVPGAPFNGATVVRDIVNSREFVLVTNPIGLSLTVDNIDIDLGSIDVIDAI